MKKLFSLVLALSFMISGFNSFSVLAKEEIKATEFHVHEECEDCFDTIEESVQPRANLCVACGSTMNRRTSYGGWRNVYKVACVHYLYGNDTEQERTVIVTYTCSSCSHSYDSVSTQSRTICNGTNQM